MSDGKLNNFGEVLGDIGNDIGALGGLVDSTSNLVNGNHQPQVNTHYDSSAVGGNLLTFGLIGAVLFVVFLIFGKK